MAISDRQTSAARADGPAGGGPESPHLNDDPDGDSLSNAEVRQRAAAGALLVAGRGAALQVLSFGGNLVLARLLLPRDFGLIAIGTAVITFGSLMATTGVGAALIRRPEPPQKEDFRAVVGFQLLLTAAVSAVVWASAAPFGQAGALAAVMSTSLPLLALRTPGAVALERALLFRKLVAVEVTENVLYYAWAVTTVALGWGVWGLATAVVARTIGGTVVMLLVAPWGFVWPGWSWARLRPILGFGALLQGTGAMNFLRDQLFNVAIAAVAGVSTLGLWTLVIRIMYIPGVLFEALWRVSFPAMSRLIAAGEDPRPIIERATGLVAVAAGALLTGVVGAGPGLLPALFGDQWAASAQALPAVALGLMIVGPISVAAAGYLAATGDAATGLRGAVLHTLALFAVALPLVPFFGLWGLALGTLASCLVESLVIGLKASRKSHARIFASSTVPTLAAVAASAVGWLLNSQLEHSLWGAVVCGALAEGLFLCTLLLTRRALLLDTAHAVAGAVRATR